MFQRKRTVFFSLVFLCFISCTDRTYKASNNEPIESQPVVISGKNVFTMSNGTVQCSYLPKSVVQYSLFCHAYVKSVSNLQVQSVKAFKISSLIGSSSDVYALASEFAPGVVIDWNPPQISSGANPLTKQVCHVNDNGLGYVCDLEFSDTIVSFSTLPLEVVAVARDSSGATNREPVVTDMRDEQAVVTDTTLLQKAGRDMNDYITFNALREEENGLVPDGPDPDIPPPDPTIGLVTGNTLSSVRLGCLVSSTTYSPTANPGVYLVTKGVKCGLKIADGTGYILVSGFDPSILIRNWLGFIVDPISTGSGSGSGSDSTNVVDTGFQSLCSTDANNMVCSINYIYGTHPSGKFSYSLGTTAPGIRLDFPVPDLALFN